MNYRHAYHAGNFGDVLKHLVLIALLEKLTQKDKPLFFLDTHAGRGLYDLEGTLARRAGEADAGIQRLAAVADLPPLAQRYLELVRGCDPANAEKLRYYPGSPLIAAMLLRDDDRAALCEIQPREAAGLREVFGRDRRIAVHERDGYEALRGLLPPRQGRGLVLIDPPYESQERELDDVAEALGLAVAALAGRRVRGLVPHQARPVDRPLPCQARRRRRRVHGDRDVAVSGGLARRRVERRGHDRRQSTLAVRGARRGKSARGARRARASRCRRRADQVSHSSAFMTRAAAPSRSVTLPRRATTAILPRGAGRISPA